MFELSLAVSGATRTFGPMGELLLCSKTAIGKMDKLFMDGRETVSLTIIYAETRKKRVHKGTK